MMSGIRIANDIPAPRTEKVFARTLALGPLPEAAGDRVLYLRPRAGEGLLDSPRRVLRRMRVGDNAFFPLSGDVRPFRARLTSAAKLQGFEITTKLSEFAGVSGLRVWRIR